LRAIDDGRSDNDPKPRATVCGCFHSA